MPGRGEWDPNRSSPCKSDIFWPLQSPTSPNHESIAKAIAPQLADDYRRWRKYTAALLEDARLNTLGAELRPELMADMVILLDRLALLEHLPRSGVVAEIGVQHGDFAADIIRITQPSRLHLIDRWSIEESLAKIQRRFADAPNVQFHRGISWEMLETFPDHYFSWVYIDAGHDFESVQRDLDAAHPKVIPGGFIAGHDYTRWAMEPGGILQRYGVVEAVNAFCNRTGIGVSCLTNEANRYVSFALKIK